MSGKLSTTESGLGADLSNDTAPVRPGEELPLDNLSKYLQDKLPHDTTSLQLQQFPGGHSNLTYLLRIGQQEYVLRRGPLGPVAPKAHDMAREFRILKSIHPHFQPAPNVYLLCEDLAVLGCVFFIMERRQGEIIRESVPPQFQTVPDFPGLISRAFIDCLATLHSVDISTPELAALGKPEGFLERQVKGWTERWHRAQTTPLPGMDRIIHWLTNGIPNPLAPTLVHNDFKLDNMMFQFDDPSRVAAVLDWEMTTIGDPLVDLGLTLCYWQLGSISSLGKDAGLYDRAQFLAHYETKTGRDLSNIRWYEILGIFKLAVILQQIYFRYHQGQTKDERFAHFDVRVAALVNSAVSLLEATS